MSKVTRYQWTALGLRPSELEFGPARFIHERDYDSKCEETRKLRELLLDIRQHQGSIQQYVKRIDAALKENT